MPAYNEGKNIYASVAETTNFLAGLDMDHEIIVVDDGSRDNTYMEARRASDQFDSVQVVKYRANAGKGHALKYGFRYANGDLVAFLDSDLDIHPRKNLGQMIAALNEMRADVVIGSKRHPESELHYPPHRRLMSTVYYLMVKGLFGLPVKDTQTGIKVFRADALKKVFPTIVIKKYAFDLELLVNAHLQGYSIREAPIVLDFKRAVSGRIRPRDVYHIVRDTAAIFYRTRLKNGRNGHHV